MAGENKRGSRYGLMLVRYAICRTLQRGRDSVEHLGRFFTRPGANPIKEQEGTGEEWEHTVESVARRV